MGFLSALFGKNKSPDNNFIDDFAQMKLEFQNSDNGKILFSNLAFYMGYKNKLTNEDKYKIYESYNILISCALQAANISNFPALALPAIDKIISELNRICKNKEIKYQFERDFFNIFNINEFVLCTPDEIIAQIPRH